MNTSRSFSNQIRGYTLVEALVAGVVLMIGVSAASRLTLTLITQDEMNQRTATAFNYQETVGRLYQMGLNESEIRRIVPADPVVDSLAITPAATAVAGLEAMESANIAITFRPSPATQSWTAHIWTGGLRDQPRTSTVAVYRSALSSTVN